MFLFRYGSPMRGVQRYIWLLRCQTWLLEPRAQGSKAAYLAGTPGSMVGHRGASSQVPWYWYDPIYVNILMWWAVPTPLKVFLFSAVAVRGTGGEAYLSDVEGNESQPSEGLSRDTWVSRMIWLDRIRAVLPFFSHWRIFLLFYFLIFD